MKKLMVLVVIALLCAGCAAKQDEAGKGGTEKNESGEVVKKEAVKSLDGIWWLFPLSYILEDDEDDD